MGLINGVLPYCPRELKYSRTASRATRVSHVAGTFAMAYITYLTQGRLCVSSHTNTEQILMGQLIITGLKGAFPCKMGEVISKSTHIRSVVLIMRSTPCGKHLTHMILLTMSTIE